MIKKHFTVDNHCNLYDNEHNVFYPVEDSRENIELLCRRLNNLVDENEQLKQQLKDYHNAFDCSQCRYQNYDWFDDGDEFEVCDKGNNEAQMDNHSCKDWEEL